MAAKNFPGPNINRLIDKDPQIIKIEMDKMDWGTRMSTFGRMNAKAGSGNPSQPSAPEMTISHVKSK